ncbi:MAG: hypothetical protein ABL973_10660 [Micropepsaceae bacterium]
MEDPFAIPRTFEGVGRNPQMLNPALGLTAVVVEAPRGLDQAFAAEMQTKISRALDEHDIATQSGPGMRSWTLKGRSSTIVTNEKGITKRNILVWRLFDPDRAQKGQFSTMFTGSNASDAAPRLSDIAKQVSDQVYGLISPGSSGSPVQVATTGVHEVSLAPIKGAPGDGNAALARAIEAALSSKQIRVKPGDVPGGWRILCEVQVQKTSAQQDRVLIVWKLIDPASKEAGTLTQDNPVPHGRLNKQWGEIAGFAAEAAAEAIQQILQQIRDEKSK